MPHVGLPLSEFLFSPYLKVLHPVPEIVYFEKDFFVHPVLLHHEHADKVTVRPLCFNVRYFRIRAVDILLCPFPDRAFRFP